MADEDLHREVWDLLDDFFSDRLSKGEVHQQYAEVPTQNIGTQNIPRNTDAMEGQLRDYW